MASAASSAKSQSQFQLVRDIAHSREQKLASEVGELIRQRASVAATMERLQGYLRDYQVGQSDHLARRLPEIENERRFVTRLNDALDQLQVTFQITMVNHKRLTEIRYGDSGEIPHNVGNLNNQCRRQSCPFQLQVTCE